MGSTNTTPAGKGGKGVKGKTNGTAAEADGAGNKGGRGKKRKTAPVEEIEDEAPFDESHVDSVEKYKDVPDWESKVTSIDTIERSNDGSLQVYMTM